MQHRRTAQGFAGLALVFMGIVGACAAPSASLETPHQVTPASSVDPLDLSALTWLALRSEEEDDSVVAVDVALVRGDGGVLWQDRVPLDPDAVASGIGVLAGPARTGRIAVGRHVDGDTLIRVVDGDGTVREVGVCGRALSGVLTRDGSALLAVVSGETITIERIELDGEPTQSRLAPMPALPQHELMAGTNLLRLTPDGRRLVVEVCTGIGACWWQIYDTRSGAESAIRPDGAGAMVDLSNDMMLVSEPPARSGPVRSSSSTWKTAPPVPGIPVAITPRSGAGMTAPPCSSVTASVSEKASGRSP